MSAAITPLGIVSQSMAAHFGIEVTTTTALFSYLTTGILLGCFLSMFVYSLLDLRQLNIVAGALLIVSLSGLWLIDQYSLVPVFLTLAGVASGLLLSAAAVVLTKAYSERSRARAMLITDTFYSGAGVISGYTSSKLIAAGWHWGSAYALAIAACTALIVIAAVSRYPDASADTNKMDDTVKEGRWPVGVYVVGLALLIYLLVFIFIYSWVPVLASETMHATLEQGGALVSQFFAGLFVGQLITFAISFRVKLTALVATLLLTAVCATFGLWMSESYGEMSIAMIALGLLSGGVLKTVITYGTMLVKTPSSTMVSFLIFCTAIGSSIAPAFSSFLVGTWGTKAVMVAVTVGYSLAALLILGTMALSRSKTRSPQAQV